MLRTLEVGRAVLSSQTSNLELWLTTLIKIVPQEHAIDMQQLRPGPLFDLLSSGNAWIGRCHDMHLDLELNSCGEAFTDRLLRTLTESIIQAPVWEQLMLKPSLSRIPTLEPGVIRLDICHVDRTSGIEGQKYHKVLYDVPQADINPPAEIPTAALQEVRLLVNLLETRQLLRPVMKRPRTSQVESLSFGFPRPQETMTVDDEDLDELLPNHNVSRTTKEHDEVTHPSYGSSKRKRKRGRPAITNSVKSDIPGIDSPRADGPHEHQKPESSQGPGADMAHPEDNFQHIQNLIEGALRVSICGSLGKLTNGLRINANTFRRSLADIMPVVWRPGYLQTLAPRACLLPTLTQSLCNIAHARATSISLRDKLGNTGHVTPTKPTGEFTGMVTIATQCADRLTASVTQRLWVHMQKLLDHKSTSPLQPCTAPSTRTNISETDDMLADFEQAELPSVIEGHPQDCIMVDIELSQELEPVHEDVATYNASSLSADFTNLSRTHKSFEGSGKGSPVLHGLEDDLLSHDLPFSYESLTKCSGEKSFTSSTHAADSNKPG